MALHSTQLHKAHTINVQLDIYLLSETHWYLSEFILMNPKSDDLSSLHFT